MGFLKDERSKKALRGFKTLFFLVTMIISFLFFSAPILFAVADALLPTTLISASLSSPADSPFPDPSLAFSIFQTLYSHLSNYDFRYSLIDIPLISIIGSGSGGLAATEVALFVCSLSLAVGHIVVVYRMSCFTFVSNNNKILICRCPHSRVGFQEDNDTTFAIKKKKSEETEPKPLVAVGRSRSQAAAHRVAPATAAAVAASVSEPPPTTSGSPATEKHLPNGDLYIESFSSNVPHRSGKYLWSSDGCMYEGDWKRGRASD